MEISDAACDILNLFDGAGRSGNVEVPREVGWGEVYCLVDAGGSNADGLRSGMPGMPGGILLIAAENRRH